MEVCLSQRWGTVTDDGWSTAEANILCKQLGYNTYGILLVENYLGETYQALHRCDEGFALPKCCKIINILHNILFIFPSIYENSKIAAHATNI